MKKRVLFLITKGTWGGAQRYVFDLATALSRDRFESIVACGGGGKLRDDLERADIEVCDIPSLGRDIMLFSDIRSFLEIWKLIREIQPDVLHVNSSKAAGIGALAGRLAGVQRIVFTVHGWPFKEPRNVLARSFMYIVSWFTAILADITIVVSETDLREGKRMPFVGEKIRHIPIAGMTPDFLERTEAWNTVRSFAHIPDESALRIATIAELTPNKGIRIGIDTILELERRGLKCVYVVIGDGEEYGRLKQYVAEHGVADKVFFTGFIPEARRYLKAFDLFLLPSVKEGTPYVLLEAAAAPLPIVATTAVDISLAKQYPGITIVPPLPHALAEAIMAKPRDGHVAPAPLLKFESMVESTSALY